MFDNWILRIHQTKGPNFGPLDLEALFFLNQIFGDVVIQGSEFRTLALINPFTFGLVKSLGSLKHKFVRTIKITPLKRRFLDVFVFNSAKIDVNVS